MELMTVLIPLPRYYNPDVSGMRREVEDEKFTETANEITAVFEGGGTIRKYDDNDKQRGFWWNKRIVIGKGWRCSKQMCPTRPRTARGLKNGRRTSSSTAFSRPRFT